MKPEHRYTLAVSGGLILLALLVSLTVLTPPNLAAFPSALFFCALIVFTTTFGVPLAGGSVSLLPMTSVAAYLVVGLVPAGWAAFVGAAVHGLIRFLWAERLEWQREPGGMRPVALAAANATMHSASILAGGAVFRWSGGVTPLPAVDTSHLLPLGLLGLTYLSVNYLIAGGFIAARGRTAFQLYLRSMPRLIFYEGAPLPFAPLMALIYTRLGLAQFVLFVLILVAASLITRDLARSHRRLERRVEELASLHAVGQALSASLNVEAVVSAIHEQVARLMPARNFYVALYDPDAGEVSFPLAVERGERAEWRSRRLGNGLTEYLLRTRAPLLIRRDVRSTIEELGLDHIGRPAACWLGVPIMAGTEPLGVIAVQSCSTPEVYDHSHQEVLVTIAAQAAAAIQNARLYARTDEALARRVRELDSILRTAHEGMLLVDLDWRALAVNRALAKLVGVAQLELVGQALDVSQSGDGRPLVELIGYSPTELQSDCEALAETEGEGARMRTIVVLGSPERHVERTLAPVRDQEGAIAGWLLLFRDVTEEVELARLRDDMMHMLVHDLRSPLAVLKGSVEVLERSFARRDVERFDGTLEMAGRSIDRMLALVNQLLEINDLESGRLAIHPEAVEASRLLESAAERLRPLAVRAELDVGVRADPNLPLLHVDPELVGRVLHNLLDNAIKFTPNGGRIELWAKPPDEVTLDRLLVGVTDDGIGIPPEAQTRLFKKFQQAVSKKGRRVGTGLGLPFCKLAVEAHGGEIWVESEIGKGSTFVMMLPVEAGG